jgi:hypothetical protein
MSATNVAGVWTGLVKDCWDLLDIAQGLLKRADDVGVSLDYNTAEFCAADDRLYMYEAANAFATTRLAVLKREGLKTGFTAGETLAPLPFSTVLTISNVAAIHLHQPSAAEKHVNFSLFPLCGPHRPHCVGVETLWLTPVVCPRPHSYAQVGYRVLRLRRSGKGQRVSVPVFGSLSS